MKHLSQPDLTIVVPAYKEEKRIGDTLEELAHFLKTDNYFKDLYVDVLVVAADAPGDKTKQITTSKKHLFVELKLLQPGPKVGKGRDVQFGMLRAKGKAIIFMDADLATPLKHLEKFYKAYLRGFGVVAATRNLRKHHSSKMRWLVSNTGNALFRIAGGVWIEDSQCGFKLFSNEAARVCFSRLTIMGWGFDMELLAIAKANGLTIRAYRVNDWVSVPEGTFVDGVIKNSLHSLGELTQIARNRLRGSYNKPL